MHMVRTNYEAWCSQQYSEYVWLTINWWIWGNPPTSKLDQRSMPDTSTGRNQETERGEPTAQRAWGPIGKKDRNRSRFPFYGEKEIWNTSSLLVGWNILEIVPCRNKVRVDSSGDSRNIHWICVSNIMQYTYIYIYIVVISACALLEYSILLLSILTRQGVKCSTGKFPETFWFISLSLPWVFEAWSYKAIQSDLSYTTGFRTIPDNSNDKADITRRSLILPAYLTQIHTIHCKPSARTMFMNPLHDGDQQKYQLPRP